MDSEDDAKTEGASRTALGAELSDEFRRRALDERECVRFTMVRHQGLGPSRISLKPMLLRGATAWQEERFDGKKVFVRNLAPGEEAEAALESMLGGGGRQGVPSDIAVRRSPCSDHAKGAYASFAWQTDCRGLVRRAGRA